MKHFFHGGIHPTDGSDKLLSNQAPIRMYTPKTVEISMKQSPNSVCQALVKAGDQVLKGDIIGKPVKFGAANIHASISGRVSQIKTIHDDQNREIEIVIIEADENEEAAQKLGEYEEKLVDLSGYSREVIIEKMKEGGLVGMGGAGFPTHVKYETTEVINYILVNAAECEPYLTCDHMLMLEQGHGIINGVLLLAKAAGAMKAFICLEDNKKDAAKSLEEIIANKDLPIEIRMLPTKYPQGGERQLVESVLGTEVPAGELPAKIGVIINNVGTAKALADIVLGNKPLTSRVVTVTGKVNNPSNYLVPIGTKFTELIKESGGTTAKINRIVEGGPMTGASCLIGEEIDELNESVSKTTAGILILEDSSRDETPCIRCGECERVCPAGLAPFKIDFAVLEDDISLSNKLYATECISCGCCTYVCPARRELAYRVTVAKNEIFKLRREGAI
ncbi:MAG: electron transport complex subunit RsxC [Clostridiales bacterium]|nr:electron transport complex subunit RsxC [Clostridiales bacterium]